MDFFTKIINFFLLPISTPLFNLLMQRFFADLETLHTFTLSLDFYQNELVCQHCAKTDQFVSHGFVYKQRSIEIKERVAKRIFCSNRHQRSGCGRTFQLYLADTLPALRYSASQLFVFIRVLLATFNISTAYQTATHQSDTRHAWRWISKLRLQLSSYRQYLKLPTAPKTPVTSQRRLHILSSTLSALFQLPISSCSQYQLKHQRHFL